MISSKLLVVADRVIKDSESSNVSIINIIEDISAESFPILIQKFAVLNLLEKDSHGEDSQNLRFKVLNNDKVLGDHQIKVDFRGKNKAKSIIQMGGVPFMEPGQAHFIIYNGEAELDRYTINLNLRDKIVVKTD